MVDIEEVKESPTLEQIIEKIFERLMHLEATVGYIIHTLDIKPPPRVEDANTGENREESPV